MHLQKSPQHFDSVPGTTYSSSPPLLFLSIRLHQAKETGVENKPRILARWTHRSLAIALHALMHNSRAQRRDFYILEQMVNRWTHAACLAAFNSCVTCAKLRQTYALRDRVVRKFQNLVFALILETWVAHVTEKYRDRIILNKGLSGDRQTRTLLLVHIFSIWQAHVSAEPLHVRDLQQDADTTIDQGF